MLQALDRFSTDHSARLSGDARKNGCGVCPARTRSICDALSPVDLARLASIASHRRAQPGEMLVTEGESTENLVSIVDGSVKLYKLLADGRRQITGLLHPGDFLGLSFSDIYTCSAEALTPVRYCAYPRQQFERLCDDSRAIGKRLLGRATSDLIAAQEQMVLLGRKTAQEKIASFLVALFDRTHHHTRPSDEIVVPMTRADIADYLGLTTETVSRGFTRLKREGLIEGRDGGKLRIAEIMALRSLASGAGVI